MTDLTHRIATLADCPTIVAMMGRAIEVLQSGYLTPEQIAASRASMGLDTQLIEDGTYFIAESHGQLAGTGGWSFRGTLYGGDDAAALRDGRRLDPARDAARIRAMYTDPAFVRRGVGRYVLALCEDAARAAGFARAELMATLAGEPLYRGCGYRSLERVGSLSDRGPPIPGVRMGKSL